MIVTEFKAWFEGFTESLEGAPSAKQWKRIKEQVAAIDGLPVTPVYIDRYIRQYPYHGPVWTAYSSALAGSNSAQMQNANTLAAGIGFDGHSAMFTLGKAEAAN